MPARKLPEVGEVFNSWTYLGEFEGRKWKCQCACGVVQWPNSCHVRSGDSAACRSCSNKTHGLKDHPLYSVWTGVKTRCFNREHSTYPEYGGRGIGMDPVWRESFTEFLQGVGERPTPQHTLDRIENDLGYFPGNTKWSTSAEQARNRRDNNMQTFDGETMCLTDWCLRYGTNVATAINRVRTQGWSWEQAIKTPPKQQPIASFLPIQSPI